MFLLGSLITVWLLGDNISFPRVFAISSWTQTDWSGGVGTSTSNQYASATGSDHSVSGEMNLARSDFFTSGTLDSTNEIGVWTGTPPTSYSGLTLYLKADTGVMSDSDCINAQSTSGGSVGCWLDQSGTAHHAIQTNTTYQPLYTTNGANGRPYIQFLGDYLNETNPFIVKQNYVVFKSPNAVFNTYGSPLGVVNAADGRTYIFQTGQAYFHANPLPAAVWKNSISVSSVGDYIISPITNWMILTLNTANSNNSRRYQIGASENSYAPQMHISEVIGFDRTLSTAEQAALENHLNLKYKTTYVIDYETTIKRSGAGAVKIIAPATRSVDFVQEVNLNSVTTHKLLAYAYTTGAEVTSADAQLFVRGSVVTTTYTSVGGGWYELSADVTGTTSLGAYGVSVKAMKTVYLDDVSLYKYAASGNLASNVFDTNQASAWGELAFTSTVPANTTLEVRVKTSNSSSLMNFTGCNPLTTATDLSTSENPQSNCVTEGHRYVQYEITYTTSDFTKTPTLSDISIAYQLADNTDPTSNASTPHMYISSSGREIPEGQWNNSATPSFTWTEGSDNEGGIGLLGYCTYLGTTASTNPESSKGILGTSPVEIPPGSTCQFIASGDSLDLSSAGLLSTAMSSGDEYYLSLKAIDIAGNVYAGSPTEFSFFHDVVAPTNVAYISTPSVNFSNVVDMNFSWPITASAASTDDDSQVIGWQYQINGTSGSWKGTIASARLGVDYIPASEDSYALTQNRDGASIVQGSNIVYFRTVDNAGNPSSSTTYRTGSLKYGGAAPGFLTSCEETNGITITPSTATNNEFSLSWPEAQPASGQTVAAYYYMINTSAPSTYSTLTTNAGTYISNSTARTVASAALPNVNKGVNTVYVVAVDNAETPNYSPSNCIKGTFTLNSTDPDNPSNLIASDSSIKSQSQWNVTLTWTEPEYQGAGNITYLVYRSADNGAFTQVGTTSGLSFVDNTPLSQTYYYKIYAKDGADATSSGTNAISIKPTGKFTSPSGLQSAPSTSGVTTKKATISWSTDRTSDSKVAYGTKSGSYGDEEPSNSAQVTAHTIKLTNLSPGTTYYYKAKWTDEDGNTGESSEKSFSTESAPVITDPTVINIGIESALVKYTVTGASKVKILYGKTTTFGGSLEVSTSASESSYSTLLEGLEDGTKYYYQINTFDSEGSEYTGNTLAFETLPRPKISSVRFQEIVGVAQPAVLVTWVTNTEVSSVVTYYPQGKPDLAQDAVSVTLTKGPHRMIVKSLLANAVYSAQVKGSDKMGNEAVSDLQQFTTSTDTRAPQIMNLKIEGATTPQVASVGQEAAVQLVVSWDTDEPATSQVEYGEGTGTTYGQKTQEDTNLTLNHLVVISNLSPARVYHMRALSKDKAGNTGNSIDTVSITPRSTRSALDLVIGNLQSVFGVMR